MFTINGITVCAPHCILIIYWVTVRNELPNVTVFVCELKEVSGEELSSVFIEL
jgi:hypothetical protein